MTTGMTNTEMTSTDMTSTAATSPVATATAEANRTLDGLAELIDSEVADDLSSASLSLARGFHRGGTLWVIAPRWEPHAHHVAVEFVHPVIMGKRALPSVALIGPDLVEQVRVAARKDDILLVVAASDDPVAHDVLRRAPAWGLTTHWIGFGPRPTPGSADHVLWVDSDDPMVPMTGRFVLLYHLLWELTHVCFENPGLLSPPEPDDCTDEVCVTCSDEGRLGEVVEVPDGDFEPAWVRTADGEEPVDVTLVAPVVAGDLLIVHAGSALTKLEDLPEVAR